MAASTFDGLGGALQDAVMESSYLTQVHVQAANEAALVNTVGFSHPHQGPDTIFAKNNVRVAALSDAEIRKPRHWIPAAAGAGRNPVQSPATRR